MSLFNELKRRNVFKVGAAYVVFAWLVAQVLQLVFESFGTPEWVMKTVLVLMATGLPFALFFAWAFEMTPEGLKREKEVDRTQSITTETGRKLNNVIMGILVLALGYFVYDKFVLEPARETALVEATRQEAVEQTEAASALPAEADNSIAVLPFVNMSGDAENEYFSDGLTEELLNSLARIKELKVTGRTSSFAFKGKNTDLREIGQTLDVAHILEGSVRKAQNRVRITAQLIKAEDGYHMWSDTFDRELDDIFAIQEEIAARVATELVSALLGEHTETLQHRDTNNVKAYEAYLHGRYLFLRNPDEIRAQDEAEQLFEKALELDPEFTLAWFGKFNVLNFRQRNGFIDYQDGQKQLKALADKMLVMNPELPESHVAKGRVDLVEMRWKEAEAAYNRALDINPGDVSALISLSGLMAVLNRENESLEYALMALERDPLEPRVLSTMVRAYGKIGRCDDAEEITNRALSLVPESGRFNGALARCLMFARGDYQKAIELYEKEPVDFIRLTGLSVTYNKLGQQEKAQSSLDELIRTNGDKASYQYGQIYAQWGQAEKALDALEYAWDISDTGIVLLNMDPHLDPIRDQPRFKALLEKWRGPVKR